MTAILIGAFFLGMLIFVFADLKKGGMRTFRSFDWKRYWVTNQVRLVSYFFIGLAGVIGILLLKNHIDNIIEQIFVLFSGFLGTGGAKSITTGKPKFTGRPTLLETIRPLYGIKEVKGKGSNPKIIRFAKDLGWEWDDDDIPWCAMFMCWVLWRTGRPHTNSPAAISYKSYGTAATEGDIGSGNVIAVFKHHVGVVIAVDGNKILLAGGNQSNSINEVWFDKTKSGFVGFRKPLE